MTVSLSDIEDAFLYVSSGPMYQNSAILCRDSGQIFYTSEMGDSDELPEDVDDADKYIEIPHKNELNLGKTLVLEFISERLPDEMERVYAIFQKKGAYSRFKQLLEAKDSLEEWYTYEDMRQKAALREWCHENNINIAG